MGEANGIRGGAVRHITHDGFLSMQKLGGVLDQALPSALRGASWIAEDGAIAEGARQPPGSHGRSDQPQLLEVEHGQDDRRRRLETVDQPGDLEQARDPRGVVVRAGAVPHLSSADELAYVYAEDDLRARARAYREAFEGRSADFRARFCIILSPRAAGAVRVDGLPEGFTLVTS